MRKGSVAPCPEPPVVLSVTSSRIPTMYRRDAAAGDSQISRLIRETTRREFRGDNREPRCEISLARLAQVNRAEEQREGRGRGGEDGGRARVSTVTTMSIYSCRRERQQSLVYFTERDLRDQHTRVYTSLQALSIASANSCCVNSSVIGEFR